MSKTRQALKLPPSFGRLLCSCSTLGRDFGCNKFFPRAKSRVRVELQLVKHTPRSRPEQQDATLPLFLGSTSLAASYTALCFQKARDLPERDRPALSRP